MSSQKDRVYRLYLGSLKGGFICYHAYSFFIASLILGQTIRSYLRKMASCAVKHFNGGRRTQEDLPEHQWEAAGFLPPAIQVYINLSTPNLVRNIVH